MAGGPKIQPAETYEFVWLPSSTILNLNQKQKSYGTLKLVNLEFLKNMFGPPFGSEPPFSTGFSWHEKSSFIFRHFRVFFSDFKTKKYVIFKHFYYFRAFFLVG